MAVVAPTPFQYQTSTGDWRRIDPRFAPVDGGFANTTNLLQIRVEAGRAAMNLQNGQHHVGWEPLAVALTGRYPVGSRVLATPRTNPAVPPGKLTPDAQTIHFAGNWSLPGLSETITGGPGQVEQSLVFSHPPAGADQQPAPEYLAFQARLHLLPGYALYADGKTQHGEFVTSSWLEILAPNGESVLYLAPPLAFEQADPRRRTAGQYHLIPEDEGNWRISVETPYTWWADSARRYPVILDPTMQVLRPFEAYSFDRDTSVDPSCDDLALANDAYPLPNDNPTPAVHVGTYGYGNGACRALIRFTELPTLPPGAELVKAELAVAPVRGLYQHYPSLARAEVTVLEVQENWPATMSINQIQWPGPTNNSLNAGQRTLSVAHPDFRLGGLFKAERYTLHLDVVNQWLQGPDTNFGLVLAPVNDLPNCNPCQFVGIPKTLAWGEEDWEKDPEDLFGGLLPLTYGGGFMLLLTYDAPTLENETPLISDILPSENIDFQRQHHVYNLPAGNSAWTAAAAKGLRSDQNFLTAYGSTTVAVICIFSNPCPPRQSLPDAVTTPNHVIVRGNPAQYNHQFAVEPFPFDPTLSHYLVEAAASNPLPDLPGTPEFGPGTGVISYTFVMSSNHVLKTFDLNLPADRRVAVEVTGPGQAYAYPPAAPGTVMSKAQSRPVNSMKIETNAANAGLWGLVIEYPSDVKPSEGDNAGQIFDVAFQIVVRACPLDSIPIRSAPGCQKVQQPVPGQTASFDVGPYTVYSEAGFDYDATSGIFTTRLTSLVDGVAYTPFIGWRDSGNVERLVAVAEGPIAVTATTLWAGQYQNNANTWLFQAAASGPPVLREVWTGFFWGHPELTDPDYGLLTLLQGNYVPLPLTRIDGGDLKISVRQDSANTQHAVGRANLYRGIDTGPGGIQNWVFDLAWTFQAESYLPTSRSLTFNSGPAPIEYAGLSLLLGDLNQWTIDFEPGDGPVGRFTNLRLTSGYVMHPLNLGGGLKPVQALILPYGAKLPGARTPCRGYCIDLRHPGDTPENPNRNWELPDITITGNAATVAMQRQGEIHVYSNDHPKAAAADTYGFSFRTFDATVKVEQGVCPTSRTDSGSNHEAVTIITGRSVIALPGIGSDLDPNQMIAADFTLCQNKLRQTSLTFQSVPGIPVANTGIFVSRLRGEVIIDPDYTQIQVQIDLRSDASASLIDGTATLTLDTAGIFDMQINGRALKVVTLEGHAWVAWDPLDIGADASIFFPNAQSWLIKGRAYGHMWQGQGWQNRYPWLADNHDMHFAASVGGTLRIQKGQIFSWFNINIPPSNLEITLTLEFGEFCNNDACTEYEWGVKGKYSFNDFDIGIFFTFECPSILLPWTCFRFILGSDGYLLVDQYGEENALPRSAGLSALPMVNGLPANLSRHTVANPTAPTVSQVFTVTQTTGSFLTGLTWAKGSPQLTLIRPDAVEITPANAVSYNVVVSDTAHSRLYGLKAPMPGQWQAVISQAAPENDYHFLYLANKGAPPVTLETPATTETFTSNEMSYPIQWTAPYTLPGVDLRLSLYYTATETTALTGTQTYGGVIREHIPLAQGRYDWDLSHLGRGVYHIYGRVDSRDNGPQTPTLSGTNQLPGFTYIYAPGAIRLDDQMPPQPPANLTATPLKDAMKVCWDVSPAKDLSGYHLFTYNPIWTVWQPLRVHATAQTGRQCARVGGLLNGLPGVQVVMDAYDASGNVSAQTPPVVIDLPQNGAATYAWPASHLTGTLQAADSVSLRWDWPGALGTWDGTVVHYARNFPAGPGRPDSSAAAGPSPLDVGIVTNTVVTGLTPGYVYHFAVQNYLDNALPSPLSNDIALLVSSGVDADGDGLPDDWETAYGVASPDDDPDGDCLKTGAEYTYLTDPLNPDTDLDGFSDGEEVAGGSDPTDPNSVPVSAGSDGLPDVTWLPRLSLSPYHLAFEATGGGLNPASQRIEVFNTGGGVLTPTAVTNVAWLSLEPDSTGITVNARATSLPRGQYEGTVTISGAAGSCTQQSPQQVSVAMWVAEDASTQNIYLPLVLK